MTWLEVVFTADPRTQRNPLHPSLEAAIAYAHANTQPGEMFELWQVADDIDRTRMTRVHTEVRATEPAVLLVGKPRQDGGTGVKALRRDDLHVVAHKVADALVTSNGIDTRWIAGDDQAPQLEVVFEGERYTITVEAKS